MFAGPNGSGKSTLKNVLRPELLGIYLNPDEMEQEMRMNGSIALNHPALRMVESEAKKFFRNSTFLEKCGLAHVMDRVTLDSN